jgi:uncharacterized protein YidB (DUF937 family)
MRLINTAICLIAVMLFANDSFAQTKKKTTTKKTTTTAKVTNTEISGGLKEALSKGVKFAVDSLGRENGYLDNARVKIPLPKSLQKLEKGLRLAGQGKSVDEFVGSMNHAAEKAVPVAIDVFVDAIKQMSFDDARKILFSGQDDSATQFFRRTSEETLREKFRPIVEEFTEKTGVTSKYKVMVGKAGFAAQLLGKDATDLDGYVTQKALDGLFLLVADEEKKIRENPIGRTTSLLRKVFGILK